eukprot:161756_1
MTNGSSIVPNPDQHSGIQHRELETVSPPASPEGAKIRGRWTHNPVVLAALACSNMGSCEEVKAVFKECQQTKSDSMVCEAAEKYYKMCHLNGGQEKNILDFSPYQD